MRPLRAALAALSFAAGASPASAAPAYTDVVLAQPAKRNIATPPKSVAGGQAVAGLSVRGGRAQPVDTWGRPTSIAAREDDDSVTVTAKGALHCVGLDASSSPSARELTVSKLARVSTLRTDRLLRRGKQTVLQTRTLWLDPNTKGLRLAQSVETPLTLLASGPRGVRIYGYRTARGLELVTSLAKGALRHPRGMAHCGIAQTALSVPRKGGDSVEVTAEIPDGAQALSGHVVTAHVSVSRLASEPAPTLSVAFRVDRSPDRDDGPERAEPAPLFD